MSQTSYLSFTKLLLFCAVLGVAHAQFIQQGSGLVPTDQVGFACVGCAAALSADGNTALIGGDLDNDLAGAAWIFTRKGGVWSQQGNKLVGSGATGRSKTQQGISVALSADGNTALIGGTGDNVGAGAAWVFVRNGAVWNQQGNKLTVPVEGGGGGLGSSVALSGDGNTALIGGGGGAYLFTRSGGVWSAGEKLYATQYAPSVALSADGNTALVDDAFAANAWVFIRSGNLWMEQGRLYSGGFGAALSAAGNTALIGGFTFNSVGAAWFYSRTDGVWSADIPGMVVGSGAVGNPHQGTSVALSGVGTTALVGGPTDNNFNGAVWVFTSPRSAASWTQLGAKMAGSGAEEGNSVALSAEGNTGLVGGSSTVWIFIVPHIRDFSADAVSDALLYDPVMGTSYTALSKGDGTYTYVYNLFSPRFDTLRTGDFNGDTKADLILYSSLTGLAYIGLGNGDGTFNFQPPMWSAGYDVVETGDLNGDGKTDVVLYNSSTGTLYTGISDGSGGFTYQYHLVSPHFTCVRPGNFSGNGNAGLFLYNAASGAAYEGVGDGTGVFTFHPLFISPGYTLADSGEVNGDGQTDVILYNPSNGNAATGISDGVGGFAFTPLIFGPGFTSVRLADFTGDGKADVIVYNKNTATAYSGTGTGTGTFNFQSLFWSPGYDWVEPEDVNGDGKVDLVLYNSTTGTEYTGISNGNGTFNYTYWYWGIGKVLAR